MTNDPSTKIFDLLQFGEYGDVNPSVCDSATFTFMQAKTMMDTFHGEAEGCFLYSRHWNPSNKYLADALALVLTARAEKRVPQATKPTVDRNVTTIISVESTFRLKRKAKMGKAMVSITNKKTKLLSILPI